MKSPFVEHRLSVFSRTARQSDGSPKPAENAETTVKTLQEMTPGTPTRWI